jgi:hypothetical protein
VLLWAFCILWDCFSNPTSKQWAIWSKYTMRWRMHSAAVLNSMTDVLVIIDSHQNIPKPGQDDNSEHNGCDRLFRIWTSTRIKKTPQLAWQKTFWKFADLVVRFASYSYSLLSLSACQLSLLESWSRMSDHRAPRCSCIYNICNSTSICSVCVLKWLLGLSIRIYYII